MKINQTGKNTFLDNVESVSSLFELFEFFLFDTVDEEDLFDCCLFRWVHEILAFDDIIW